jgi:ParB/RepB/Spo0J family partition protein
MAKRKRLTPANPAFLGGGHAPLEGATKSAPPIADVASEAAATAALAEVSETLRTARESGRMVLELSLDEVQADYLVRDRQSVSDDDTDALMTSLRARGQQTPIEVMQIDGGGYGLISGWRRLNALRRLRDEEGGVDQVLALLRRPEQAGDAYQAMIEENEIRVGLSYFERARIVQKSVENGVFETEKAALRALFASASPAKRSKIKSFMSIVRHLDGALTFPEALGERAGLALVKVLEEDPKLAAELRKALVKAAPQDAMAELRVLQTVPRTTPAPKTETKSPEIALLSVEVDVLEDGSLRLHGDGVTPALRAKLQAWLAKQRV